jgi:nitroimidazol reductase NimA-like FMN-containing flavoprotein (pyridoxamine 5'-phosphate oxidase superfamily)
MTAPADSPRRVRRYPQRQSTDRNKLNALLDAELVGHLSMRVGDEPIVVPMAYARIDEHIVIHGSTGGGFALRAAAAQQTVAFSVATVDALVYARSLFDSSFNYRSAVVYGVLEELPSAAEEATALAFSDRLMPGRSREVRAVTRKELAATRMLRLALTEVIYKERTGDPSEAEDDGEDRTVWCGLLPVGRSCGVPVPSPLTPDGVNVPGSVRALTSAD